MISLVNGVLPRKYVSDPIAQRICAYHTAYGTDYDFCRFYTGGGVLAMLYCGELFVSAEEHADFSELSSFIGVFGGGSVMMNEACFKGVRGGLSAEAEELCIMLRDNTSCGAFLSDTRDYAGVYGVLSDAFALIDNSDFERWYTDSCHRVRHGVSRLYMLCENDEPAAVCTVLYDNDEEAFLSHIGVKEKFRGRGLGKRIVDTVAQACKGKRVSLICKKDKLPFYKHCGFTYSGNAYQMITGEKK